LVARFGDTPANEFGAKKFKQVRQDMIELDWSRTTINKAGSIIKRFFRWAGEEEFVSAEVAGAIWPVRGLEKDRSQAREPDPVGPVADEIVEATLAHVSQRIASMIRVMRLTGMRPGEALGMTKAEINMTGEVWTFSPHAHKTTHKRKERRIPIGPQCQAVLLPWIVKAPTGRIFPIRRDSLRQAIHRGCQRAGVPNWHPNQLRHSFATNVRATHGIEAAQVLLGHAKADITEVYAERNERLASDIAKKIG
jgi:integrase